MQRFQLMAGAVLVLLAVPLFSQTPTVQDGPQFQVNTYTTDRQTLPSVAVAPDGRFVVVWTSRGSDNGDMSAESILGQRFTSNGVPIGDEFLVNTYTTNEQTRPAVAVSANGDFVVVWQSDGSDNGDTSSESIQGQRFASDGLAQGAQFRVNSYTTSYQRFPSVAMAEDGDFVVAWESYEFDTDSFYSIQGQRYASDGTPRGDEFRVNGYTTSYQRYPAVAATPAGDFIVVWASFGSFSGDTSGFSIQGKRYLSNGTPRSLQFQINTVTNNSQLRPSVAVVPNGDFVVVWDSYRSFTAYESVQARRYQSNGVPGDEFRVNTYTTGRQRFPAVGVDPDGDFVVVWDSDFSDLGDQGGAILGQRYASNSDPIGGEFLINTYTTGEQSQASAAVAPGGDFIVAWQSNGSANDTASFSIQAQRFQVTAEVGNKVFLDDDFDGRQDSSEVGVAGVNVHLRDGLGDLIASTTTDDQGDYRFFPKIGTAGVVDNFYIEFEAPPFTEFTAMDVGTDDRLDSDAAPGLGETATFQVLSAGEAQLEFDAGLISNIAVIGDRIWWDANGDSIQQIDETGVAGVSVRLLDDVDNVVQVTETDLKGFFVFLNVDTGTYTIEVVLPDHAEFGDQDVGGDAADSDVDPLTGRMDSFKYTAGTIRRDLDAAIVFPAFFADGFESGDTSAWSSTMP